MVGPAVDLVAVHDPQPLVQADVDLREHVRPGVAVVLALHGRVGPPAEPRPDGVVDLPEGVAAARGDVGGPEVVRERVPLIELHPRAEVLELRVEPPVVHGAGAVLLPLVPPEAELLRVLVHVRPVVLQVFQDGYQLEKDK